MHVMWMQYETQCASDMRVPCMQHAHNMRATASSVHPTFTQHACGVHAACLRHACTTRAPCLQHACIMLAPCMHHAWQARADMPSSTDAARWSCPDCHTDNDVRDSRCNVCEQPQVRSSDVHAQAECTLVHAYHIVSVGLPYANCAPSE